LNSLLLFVLNDATFITFDKNNLINSDSEFDYSVFVDLEESQKALSPELTAFTFLFKQPGNFVFKLNDVDDKITIDNYFYIKIMDASSACPEFGPFFPPTETYFTKTGLRERD